jgi:hypothetical protein
MDVTRNSLSAAALTSTIANASESESVLASTCLIWGDILAKNVMHHCTLLQWVMLLLVLVIMMKLCQQLLVHRRRLLWC